MKFQFAAWIKYLLILCFAQVFFCIVKAEDANVSNEVSSNTIYASFRATPVPPPPCIQNKSVTCQSRVILKAANPLDCQTLCKWFEFCSVFTFHAEGKRCILCKGYGALTKSEDEVAGPAECEPSTHPVFPDHCTVPLAFAPGLIANFSSFNETSPFECQKKCANQKTCRFATYDGVECRLIPTSFIFPVTGEGLSFGVEVGSVVLGKTCVDVVTTRCLRRGEAFFSNSLFPNAARLFVAETVDECRSIAIQQAQNAFSFWVAASLCIVTSDIISEEPGVFSNVLLSIDLLGSATTESAHRCAASPLPINQCITQGDAECRGYEFSLVDNIADCAMICRDLVACDRLVYFKKLKHCKICWMTHNTKIGSNEIFTGTRACLTENLEHDDGYSSLCAVPFQLYNEFNPLVILENRSPKECQQSCARESLCRFASYTGHLCILHTNQSNVGGLSLEYGNTGLIIAKACTGSIKSSSCYKLVAPPYVSLDYTVTESADACQEYAQHLNLQERNPFQTFYYWPAHSLCSFTKEIFHSMSEGPPLPQVGVIGGPLNCSNDTSFWTFAVIGIILATILLLVLGICCFFHQRRRTMANSYRVDDVSKSLHASGWDHRPSIMPEDISDVPEQTISDTPLLRSENRSIYHFHLSSTPIRRHSSAAPAHDQFNEHEDIDPT